MKTFLIIALAFTSLTALAQSTLGTTGFTITEDSAEVQVLNFKNMIEFKISKDRFSTQSSAMQFCVDQKSELDGDFNSLLIAMTGAADESEFLYASIAFNIQDTSGIWQWSKGEGKVMLMFNGGGTNREEVSEKELSQFVDLSIPSICAKKF